MYTHTRAHKYASSTEYECLLPGVMNKIRDFQNSNIKFGTCHFQTLECSLCAVNLKIQWQVSPLLGMRARADTGSILPLRLDTRMPVSLVLVQWSCPVHLES